MSLTGLAFLLSFCAASALALYARPMFGLYIYIAVLYLHPPSRWWGEGLPEIRWSLVAAAITLLSLLIHRNSNERSAIANSRPQGNWYDSMIAKGLIAYVLWMWTQAPWVLSDVQITGAVLFTKYLVLFYLIVQIIDNEKDFSDFCLANIIGCGYLGWLIYLAPGGGRLEGVGGPGIDNANTLGMHLSVGLFFTAFHLLTTVGWRRWVTIACLPLILNGIIQTETRGAIVGILAGGLVTLYLKPRRYRKRFYLLAMLGVVSVIVVANEAFVERMQTLRAGVDETSEWDNSAISRIAVANAQFRMFANHPLGVGHQGTAMLSREYLEEKWRATDSGDRASHNTVLSILVDQGIVGIVVFTIMMFSIIRMLARMKRLDRSKLPKDFGFYRAMLGGSIAVVYAAGMFAQYLKAEIQIWILALLAVLWQLARTEVEHTKLAKPTNAAQPRNHGAEPYRVGPEIPNRVRHLRDPGQ